MSHTDNSNTRIGTPPSNGRGENSVRTMKYMIQRQKRICEHVWDQVFDYAFFFSLLVRHSEWLLIHRVRSDFQVEAGARVVKTSPYEGHTGNPAPRDTDLLKRILVRRREDDDKQPRSQQAWFLGVIAGGGEVKALHPGGTQRHHGE